jgi:hypothetical protein
MNHNLKHVRQKLAGPLIAMLLLAALTSKSLAKSCYDMAEILIRWEGFVSETHRTKALYETGLNGTTQKAMDHVLDEWVKKGASPAAIDMRGAMRQAVNSCYGHSLRVLVDHGADPNAPIDGDAPIRITAASVFCQEKSGAVAVTNLLEKGARPDDVDEIGQTALMRAALAGRPMIIETLLTHGARIDLADCAGHTALHWAAAAGTPKAVEVLLKHGADREKKDAYGQTPLKLAVKFSNRPLENNTRAQEYQKVFALLQSPTPSKK